MVRDDFRVEVIGHACLRVQARGYTLLTDPWLVGTIGSNLAGLFPPPTHDPVTVAAETDAIFLSHDHPDHLKVLDGITDWEALHFLGDVSIHQVRYASGFARMLRAARRLPSP